jgi:hypothetical protein
MTAIRDYDRNNLDSSHHRELLSRGLDNWEGLESECENLINDCGEEEDIG